MKNENRTGNFIRSLYFDKNMIIYQNISLITLFIAEVGKTGFFAYICVNGH